MNKKASIFFQPHRSTHLRRGDKANNFARLQLGLGVVAEPVDEAENVKRMNLALLLQE